MLGCARFVHRANGHKNEPAKVPRDMIIDSEASEQKCGLSKRTRSVFVNHIPPETTWNEVKQAFVTQEVGTPTKIYYRRGRTWAHAYFNSKFHIDNAIARAASPQGILIHGQRVSIEPRGKKKRKKKSSTAYFDHREPRRASSTSPGPHVQDLDQLMHELRIASERVGRGPSPRRALVPFSSDRGQRFSIASGGRDRSPLFGRATSHAESLAQGHDQHQQERNARPSGTFTTPCSTAGSHVDLRWQYQNAKLLYSKDSQQLPSRSAQNIAPRPAAVHSAGMIPSEHPRVDWRSQYRDAKWRQTKDTRPPPRAPSGQDITFRVRPFSPWTRPSCPSAPWSDSEQNPVGSFTGLGQHAVPQVLLEAANTPSIW